VNSLAEDLQRARVKRRVDLIFDVVAHPERYLSQEEIDAYKDAQMSVVEAREWAQCHAHEIGSL
jgi:hypothetical protein